MLFHAVPNNAQQWANNSNAQLFPELIRVHQCHCSTGNHMRTKQGEEFQTLWKGSNLATGSRVILTSFLSLDNNFLDWKHDWTTGEFSRGRCGCCSSSAWSMQDNCRQTLPPSLGLLWSWHSWKFHNALSPGGYLPFVNVQSWTLDLNFGQSKQKQNMSEQGQNLTSGAGCTKDEWISSCHWCAITNWLKGKWWF
jgi:hypothetical protein